MLVLWVTFYIVASGSTPARTVLPWEPSDTFYSIEECKAAARHFERYIWENTAHYGAHTICLPPGVRP